MEKIKKESIVIGIDIKEHNESYINLISKIFDIKKIYSFTELIDYKRHVDLLIFTGGSDINPAYYNQKVGEYTVINESRDKIEMAICDIYRDSFKLGICRGAQLLTVKSGGSLIQHINNHNRTHNISLKGKYMTNVTSNIIDKYYDEKTETFEFPMTSSHHQMMYPYNMNKDKYDLIAWSTFFLSSAYLDGNNNNINLNSNFLEPEIIYYKNTGSLCIQGHPEYSDCNTDTVDLILKLILNYIK